MSIDWSKVLKKHIEETCSLHDTGKNIPKYPARNTFFIHNKKQYPAKFIRGLAYKIATGTVCVIAPGTGETGGRTR